MGKGFNLHRKKRWREPIGSHAVQPPMRLFLPALFLACTAAAAAADMHSAECSDALARLQAQEDLQRQTGAQDDATRLRWQGLRTEAARRCLGGDGSLVSPSQHQLRSPIAVAPIAAAARMAAPPAIAMQPALRLNAPPLTLTSCDATGCFASDGSRLTRAGAGLIGPKGLCTVQGNFLQCP